MTKYECAARISEKGTVIGKAGDQTGKEVCITPYSNYSNGGYDVALRYYGDETLKVRNRIVSAACRFAKSNRVGYSQPTRSTLYEQMQNFKWKINKCKKISLCNTDCSAFVGVVVNVALVPLGLASPIPDDIWTGNEESYLTARGFEKVKVDFNKTSSNGMLPGDILINYENHTTIIIGNSPKGQLMEYVSKDVSKTDLDVIAREVIDGKWGNGSARRSKLKAAGYDVDAVQMRVNELLALEGC